jgi:Ca-activated chloride channel family protein
MIELYYGQWLPIIASLILFVSVCAVILYRYRRTFFVVRLLTKSPLQQVMLMHFSRPKLIFKTFSLIVGFLFLSIALLRPQSPGKKVDVPQEGRDVFIALDISRSMLATDCLPSRLECAKTKIRGLLKQLTCERVGLILFSGTAFIQCPLTHDYTAFFMFLDQLDVETISSGSTVIDQAIALAANQVRMTAGRNHTLLVLVTDGEDFSSSTPTRPDVPGLHIFALGMGTKEGAPIPLFDLQGRQIGHQKDQHGTIVISKLNEELLRTITQQTGGTYIPATKDDGDIKTITHLIQKYEKEKFSQTTITERYEWYPLCVAVSLVCFLIEWLL